MEVLLYVGGVFGLLLGAFIFVEKPYFIVGILVFMIAYLFNLNVPGPLDLRGLLLLMIFARLFLFDKNNLQLVMNVLFKSKWFYLTLIFLFSYAIVTYFNVAGASAKEPVKSFVLNVIAIITGFIIISNKEGRNAFAFGIIITGLISVFDLVFHYVQFGGISGELTLFRPLDLLSTREDLRTNHNFPGMLIGFAFILAYLQFILKKWTKYISLIFMIIFAIGIFLSTSRSTILGLIVVFLIVSFTIKNTNVNFKKIIYSLIIFSFFYLGFYFYYEFFCYKQNH